MIEPIHEGPHPAGNGVQRLYRFENGYGASVIRFELPLPPEISLPFSVGSYGHEHGRYELAVIKWHGIGMWDWDIVDVPEIGGGDVVGNLAGDDVQDVLEKISALPTESASE